MKHFVGCIMKYGNPDSLKWTDHPSLHRFVKIYSYNRHQRQEGGTLPWAADIHRNEKEPREFSKDTLLTSLGHNPLTSIAEKNKDNAVPVYKPPERDALLQKDVVRPIHKRRDAIRRSKYNPDTIARDVLLAIGSHPNMDPLNAHLDNLRKTFKAVNYESDMSTFRWDLVDPEQEVAPGCKQRPGQESERQAEQQIKPEQSAPNTSKVKRPTKKTEINHVQRYYDTPSNLLSPSASNLNVLHNEAPFEIFPPELTHFGPMSTIFVRVFDRDPSARLMSSTEDLWAGIFTMLERRYRSRKFVIRTAVRRDTGDVIGWIACHEVNTPRARSVDSSAYLDWTTAAHLLPSQLSRFTTTKEGTEAEVERSIRRKIGDGLASTVHARATEAQDYIVPIRRLVINALAVHPLHQGRGVASALLKSITDVADLKKRPIWLQAPEDPAIARGVLRAGLFRRSGFTCAGELNLDLDSYALGPGERYKEKGVKFGTYKWNYMLRWPMPVAPKAITAAIK